MRNFKAPRLTVVVLATVFSISLSNCAVQVGTNNNSAKSKPLPPGQAKKITGEKSAKNYAPGHNK
ncbi:hypothetical protein [Flavobacterium sp. WC2509]|uniref:hypothetical protein n=1 Tax=Flavobacterium sp. WC2509 TaxID=3461406 RepID=UPI004044170E